MLFNSRSEKKQSPPPFFGQGASDQRGAGQHDFMHGDAGTPVEDDLRGESALDHATPIATSETAESASGSVQVPALVSPPTDEPARERLVAESEQSAAANGINAGGSSVVDDSTPVSR
jgi:hypothetical protein